MDTNELFKKIEELVNKAVTEAIKAKPPQYFTNKQAAQLLGISVSTIDRLRKKGTLKYFQSGSTIIIPDYEIQRMIFTNKCYINSELVNLNTNSEAFSTLS